MEITKNKNMKLGKGMAALLGAGLEESAKTLKESATSNKKDESSLGNGHVIVDINLIKTNKGQPRKIFKEKEIEELSQSIKENGIIQPLIVSQLDDGSFELIAGERRLRASKLAGLANVPVVIKKVTRKDLLLMAIIENVQRADLNCVEEALAYYQLMDEFNLTQEEVAKKIGKERSTIANFLRVLKLPRDVIAMLQREELTFGHAKVLASIKEEEKILELANKSLENNWSVRDLESDLNNEGAEKPERKERQSNVSAEADAFRKMLEEKTGLHFEVKLNKKYKGKIVINISNKDEANKVFEQFAK